MTTTPTTLRLRASGAAIVTPAVRERLLAEGAARRAVFDRLAAEAERRKAEQQTTLQKLYADAKRRRAVTHPH